MTPLPESERILIFDFGAQYVQLIARRVREQNVFCQIVRHDLPASRVAELHPKGLILSGGPASVYEANAPHCDPAIFDLGIPILGICYGMQLACQALGGEVKPGPSREFGRVSALAARSGRSRTRFGNRTPARSQSRHRTRSRGSRQSPAWNSAPAPRCSRPVSTRVRVRRREIP